jgi:hypothetical protein
MTPTVGRFFGIRTGYKRAGIDEAVSWHGKRNRSPTASSGDGGSSPRGSKPVLQRRNVPRNLPCIARLT